MAKINELREKRAKIWEQAKAFLDSHRNETGILSAEDTAAYEKMEKDIVDLGHEIDRQQRADELERELNLPTSTPLVSKPDNANRENKTGTASEKYNKAFWNQMRNRSTQEVRNILSEGVDSEGGFLVPETFENTLVQALDEELVIRQLAHTFTTASNAHKIPVVATRGKAMWTEENAAITDSDTSFGQKTIGAHMYFTVPQGTPLVALRKKMVGINNPNPKAALDVTGEIYMNGFSVMGLQQSAIADDVSLNELTSPGIYFRRSLPQENLNYPALVFGMLEVFSCSVNLVIQRYTARDSPFDTYIRSRVNSTWSAWVKKLKIK